MYKWQIQQKRRIARAKRSVHPSILREIGQIAADEDKLPENSNSNSNSNEKEKISRQVKSFSQVPPGTRKRKKRGSPIEERFVEGIRGDQIYIPNKCRDPERAIAKYLGIGKLHYRILKILVDAQRDLTYGEIDVRLSPLKIFNSLPRFLKEGIVGSLTETGYTRQTMQPSASVDKMVISFKATAKGKEDVKLLREKLKDHHLGKFT